MFRILKGAYNVFGRVLEILTVFSTLAVLLCFEDFVLNGLRSVWFWAIWGGLSAAFLSVDYIAWRKKRT